MAQINRNLLRGVFGRKAAEVEKQLRRARTSKDFDAIMRRVPPDRLDDLEEDGSRITTSYVRLEAEKPKR
jgi:hypothetical protein